MSYCPICFSEMKDYLSDYTKTRFIATCTNPDCEYTVPHDFLSGYWSCARDILHFGKLEKIREAIGKMK